ncbi:MAG: hypothetical protein ACI4RA_03535 [Kiritimatiellia bacterium]
MNRKFGRVENGRIVYAPSALAVAGGVVVNPSAATYAANGWLPNEETRAEPPDGMVAVSSAWTTDGARNVRVWEYAPAPRRARRFSKLRLYAALARAGLWDGLVEWLKTQTVDGINAYTAFELAQDLTEDDEMFAPFIKGAKSALGVTDEQVEAILAACVLEGA